jgi:hypothetical protein
MLLVLFSMLQEPPLMTEDMHEERMQAVEAIGDSFVSSNFYLFVTESSNLNAMILIIDYKTLEP